MGEEGGTQFNGVARLEARFAEELRGQFQRGDVACVHVDAGEVDDARGRLIARGRRAGAKPDLMGGRDWPNATGIRRCNLD